MVLVKRINGSKIISNRSFVDFVGFAGQYGSSYKNPVIVDSSDTETGIKTTDVKTAQQQTLVAELSRQMTTCPRKRDRPRNC